MKVYTNYTIYRGWDIDEFEVSGEKHYKASKDGTSIAVKCSQEELFELLDSIDFRPKVSYNN